MGLSKQEHLKWLQGRQKGVGSSDSPVLALPPEKVFKKTAVDLYISKIRTITMDDIDAEEDNPNFRRGHTYEPLAVAMFQAQTGIKVHAPVTDFERFHGFQVQDPDSPMFCDFDGFCEDGWVYEGKAPIQRVCDSFRTQGIKEYYMVQAQHLAHLANVCELPFLGKDSRKWLGKIKGTRLVVYEPEKVQLQIVELPIDHDMIGVIVQNAKRFFNEHVLKKVPPGETVYDQPVAKKATAGRYTEMSGQDWQDAVNLYKLAKERDMVAKAKLDEAKAGMVQKMKDAGEEAINIGPHKFLYRLVAGRRTFDKKALQADFPDLDLDKYMKQSKPNEQFNYYGPKEQPKTGDDELDGKVMTIHAELEAFAKQELDPEDGVDMFDDLRGRADLYAAMLEMELGAIRNGIEKAANAIVKRLG